MSTDMKSPEELKKQVKERVLSKSISSMVQIEVARIREMITITQTLLPNDNVNFMMYEMTLDAADRAVREQDVVALIKLLPELHGMH